MELREERRGDVAILSLSGRVMSGPDVFPFHDHIKGLAAEGIHKVVIDLAGVSWFGSAMLGVMTSGLVTLQSKGGGMMLTGITPTITKILVATRLDGVFQTRETVDEAVNSFEIQPS